MLCPVCLSDPCKAHLYKQGLLAEYSLLSPSMSPSHKRNHLYRKFVYGEHGTLGRRVRVRIPECVVAFIREWCPEPSGQYTGHRDIDEEGEETPNNDSFESALPEGHVGELDFNSGVKVKVCVSFENARFPISHVRNFIQESNVPGWSVSFVEDTFTNATILCDTESKWNEVFFYCTNNMEQLSEVVYDTVN